MKPNTVSPVTARKIRWKWKGENAASRARAARDSSSARCSRTWSTTRLTRRAYSSRLARFIDRQGTRSLTLTPRRVRVIRRRPHLLPPGERGCPFACEEGGPDVRCVTDPCAVRLHARKPRPCPPQIRPSPDTLGKNPRRALLGFREPGMGTRQGHPPSARRSRGAAGRDGPDGALPVHDVGPQAG